MNIGDAVLRILGDTSDVEHKVEALGGKIRAALPTAAKYAIGGVAAGIALTAASAVKGTVAFAGFQDSMLNTRTIAQMSDEDFTSLSHQVLDLSKKFPVATGGADALADALYQAVSSGIPAGDAMNFLQTAAEGATAGATDTATVVQVLAGTMNAYHLKADKAREVSDLLFQTVNRGVVEMPELAASMSTVTAVAASAGVSLPEVAAGIATLTKAGIQGAEATTDLRSVIEAVVNANGPLLEILKQHGYESGQAALKDLGLQGVLKMLHGEVGNNTQAWFELIPRVEGVQAALGLTGQNAQSAADDLESMAHASDGAGAAHEAFEIKEKGLSDQWEVMLSKAQSLSIEMGEKLAPAASWLMKQIMALMDGTSPLSPLLETIGNVINNVVSFIVRAVQNWAGIVQSVMPTIIAIFQSVGAKVGPILNTLRQMIASVVEWIKVHMPEIVPILKAVGFLAGVIIGGFIDTFKLALDAISHVMPAISAIIETVMAVISGVINVVLDIISGDWGKAWTDIQTMFAGVWHGILDFIGSIPELLLGILEGLLVAVTVWAGGFAGKLLGWAGKFVGRFIGWFGRIPGEAMGAIGGLPGRIMGFLGSLLGKVVGWLGSLVGKFVGFFKDVPGKAVNALASLPGKIIDFLLQVPGKIASAALRIGKHIMDGIVDGVLGAIGNVINTVQNAVGNVVGGVLDFLGIHSPSRVFAEIGQQSMAGLAQGLGDITAPMRALQGGVAEIVRRNPLTLTAQAAGAAAAAGGSGNAPINIYGPIHLPNVSDAEGFVDALRHLGDTR